MAREKIQFDISRLRCLIGTRVTYNGHFFEIIEILEDEPAVILQTCEPQAVIQADQHGEAHRRVPSTLTVPVLSSCRTELHPAFLSLDITDHLIVRDEQNNSPLS